MSAPGRYWLSAGLDAGDSCPFTTHAMSLDVALLERTFDRIRPNADGFARDFYADLFDRYPETRQLFAHTDFDLQRRKLVDALVLVIENLENGELLQGALRSLGQRHVRVGVAPVHYGLVAESLLATLEKHLGDEWTPAARQAWTDAYVAIAGIMKAA